MPIPRKLPRCAVPLSILPVALLVDLRGLGQKPFWLDEVTTLRRATMPFSQMISDSVHNNHYPAYFVLIWLVAHVGTSQWILRLPSALFASIAAAITGSIGNLIGKARVGLVAGLLFSLSPFDVQLAQEARSYALVSCLILIALWGMVELAPQMRETGTPGKAEAKPSIAWWAYGIGTACALNVLNVAAAWFVAANVAACFIAARAGATNGAWFRRWALMQACILVAWAPALVSLLVFSYHSLSQGASWGPQVTSRTIWEIVAPVYFFRISDFITFDLKPASIPGLSAVLAVLAAAGAWRLRHTHATLAVLISVAVAVPIGMLVLSYWVPMLVPRYFAWTTPAFCLLVAAGSAAIPPRWFVSLSAALMILTIINLQPYYKYETKPRWDVVASELTKEAQPGDVVLCNDYASYYVLQAFLGQIYMDSSGVIFTWVPYEATVLARGHNVWTIYGRTGQGSLPSSKEYLDSLTSMLVPITGEAIGQHIMLWHMEVL